MTLRFGDEYSIQQARDAAIEAEVSDIFPRGRIIDLLDLLEDYYDFESHPDRHTRDRMIKVVQKWIGEQWRT